MASGRSESIWEASEASQAGSHVLRLRPQHLNHVWSYEFVLSRTHDGRLVRMLTQHDEFTEGIASEIQMRKRKHGNG